MKQYIQRRIHNGQVWLDLVILGLLLIPLTYGLAHVQAITSDRLSWGDGPWYLNRALLINRGIWPEFYVYTLGQPVLVSLFERLTGDVVAAGVLVNRVGTGLFLIGTYLLGRLFFNRQVGLLAFLMVLCSVFVRILNRLLQPFMLFYGLTTITLIAFWFAIKRPGYWSAFFLGLFLNACFFTRFEGVSYAILIPIAGLAIYRQHGWKLALTCVATSSITFLVGFGFYMGVLLNKADPGNGVAFTFLALLQQQPFPTEALIQRLLLTGQSLTFYWSPIIWLVALLSVIWGLWRRSSVLPYVLGLTLLAVNFLNQFVLSIEPIFRLSGPVYPVIAVLFVDFWIRLSKRFPAGRYLIMIPLLSVIIPELFVMMRLSMQTAQDHRAFEAYQTAQAIDQYLTEANLSTREVYTFCDDVALYSRSQLQIIYRVAFRDLDSTAWWNSPENLFAGMAANGSLYMDCENAPIYYRDWRDWIEGKLTTTYRLEPVGEMTGFTFFEAVPNTSPAADDSSSS